MWTPSNQDGSSSIPPEQDGVYWFFENFVRPLSRVPVRFYLEAGWKELFLFRFIIKYSRDELRFK